MKIRHYFTSLVLGVEGLSGPNNDPEGDMLLLRSSEAHRNDLEGDRDGVDLFYFGQEYLGP